MDARSHGTAGHRTQSSLPTINVALPLAALGDDLIRQHGTAIARGRLR
jgi:hypothetical protein